MSKLAEDIRLLKRMNWFMTVGIGMLLVIGVLFIYSACCFSEEQWARSLYKKQIVWIAVGVICYLAFALTDYWKLRKLSWWAYGACIVLLVIVWLIDIPVSGSRRWLIMPFNVKIQPSELTKLAVIIVLARMLSRPGVNFGRIKPLAAILATVAVPVLLIFIQPNLGTAIVFVFMVFIMMFVADVPLKALGVLAMIGLGGIGILLGALFLPEKLGANEEQQRRILRLTGLNEYQKNRIVVFFQPDRDPLGAGWNKTQSEIAVGSGGKWGKGFLLGTQNILGFLPRAVAPTDFIYSVIAEEMGFFGSAVVLLLFVLIGCYGIQAALMARDKMERLLCTGVVAMIFCHAFINIAMTVGLMPITGLPLPLLSYGGSFMIVTMSALGIIQSVYIRSRRTVFFC